jgi:WD40 repeat protein
MGDILLRDSTVILWKVGDPFQVYRRLDHISATVAHIAWSPSGRWLLTRSSRGLRIWDPMVRQQCAILSCHHVAPTDERTRCGDRQKRRPPVSILAAEREYGYVSGREQFAYLRWYSITKSLSGFNDIIRTFKDPSLQHIQ